MTLTSNRPPQLHRYPACQNQYPQAPHPGLTQPANASRHVLGILQTSRPHIHLPCHTCEQTRAQAPQRALVLGVFNGTPYLLQPTDWKDLSHHASLLVTMVRMLQHLADHFGGDLPDVAYTVTSSDTPRVSMRAGSVG